MSWILHLLQAERLQKVAQWGEIQIIFGRANINSLAQMVQEILATETVDPSKRHWFNQLKNSPYTAQVTQNNGQSLVPAQAIQDVLFNLSQLSPNKAELNRLSAEVEQRVLQRQEQTQRQKEERHIKSRKVTTFRFSTF